MENNYEPRYLKRWKRPDRFIIGPSDEDKRSECYVVIGRTRDSNLIGNSNYECLLRDLPEKAKEIYGDDAWEMYFDDRDSHWACGWVEMIYIHESAHSLLVWADDVMRFLKQEYPVYDDMDHSEREYDAIQKLWGNETGRWRVKLLEECKFTEWPDLDRDSEEFEEWLDGLSIPESIEEKLREWVNE